MHHTSLANDLAHLGIANTDGADDTQLGQGGLNSAGLGLQGAGRSRYARKTSGRYPLGVSMNGSNMKGSGSKYDQNMDATAKGIVRSLSMGQNVLTLFS